MADATLQILGGLEDQTATAAYWLVWAARTAGYPVVVTSGRRSSAEQAALVAAGRSRTLQSKHVTGRAFDIDWHGWDRDTVPSWFWQLIGPWAEMNLGLVWGGRWLSPYDPGHFEAP